MLRTVQRDVYICGLGMVTVMAKNNPRRITAQLAGEACRGTALPTIPGAHSNAAYDHTRDTGTPPGTPLVCLALHRTRTLDGCCLVWPFAWKTHAQQVAS